MSCVATKNNIFHGFAILKEPTWDEDYFRYHLKKRWDIVPEENFPKESENIIDCFSIDDIIVSVGLIKEPISNGEAEESAKNNFFWPEALEIVKTHKAYLSIYVEGDRPIVDLSETFVKIMATCCDDENVLGIYNKYTVLEPSYYTRSADTMREDVFPITNLIWFGAYRTQKGICAYTQGMEIFQKKNIEIIDSKKDLQSIMEFLQDIASYVISNDVEFKSRESVGLDDKKLYEIFLSKGVALPQEETFKIDYR